MRKQTILSVAGLALAAGLGYAAMSSAGLAPGIAPRLMQQRSTSR